MPKSNYQKQNFRNGNVLRAKQLNHIESGLASKIDKVQGADHAGDTFIVDENGNVQLTPMPKPEESNAVWKPTVTEDGEISWEKSADETAPATQNIKGNPGFSPTASVEETDEGAVVTITDENGTTTATIRNGTSSGGSGSGDLTPITTDEIDEICSDGTEEEPVLIEEDDDAVEVQSPEEETV